MTDTTQTPDDEFAAAFSELSTPGSTSSTPTAAAATSASPSEVSPSTEEVAAGAERTAAAVPPAEPGNAASTPATPAAGVAAATSTAPSPAATPAAEPDYAAQLAALNAKIAELEKTPAPAAAEVKPAPQPQPIYDTDEQAVVESYLKDWPEVAKGEALMRRAEYQQMMQYIWNQFGPRIDALESSTQNVSTRTQYQDIKELVPDYDAVRDATLAWIDTQPAYLKTAYQQVTSSGTPKDVADLIGRFKKETNYVAANGGAGGAGGVPAGGVAPAASAPAAPAAAATPAAGLAPAAAAAAAALKPVKTARSEPVSAPDPNDFEAAFKEFSSAA